jgi:hypothetical protein
MMSCFPLRQRERKYAVPGHGCAARAAFSKKGGIGIRQSPRVGAAVPERTSDSTLFARHGGKARFGTATTRRFLIESAAIEKYWAKQYETCQMRCQIRCQKQIRKQLERHEPGSPECRTGYLRATCLRATCLRV